MDWTKEKTEEWRPVKDYEGWYEVSSQGRVRSIKRCLLFTDGRRRNYPSIILSLQKRKDGYLLVNLRRHRSLKTSYVHIFVANAFLGIRPAQAEVNHKDGIKDNNAVSNLEWVTRNENIQHSYDIGIRRSCWERKIIRSDGKVFESIARAARFMNGNKSCISHVLNGRNKTHQGFSFSHVLQEAAC